MRFSPLFLPLSAPSIASGSRDAKNGYFKKTPNLIWSNLKTVFGISC